MTGWLMSTGTLQHLQVSIGVLISTVMFRAEPRVHMCCASKSMQASDNAGMYNECHNRHRPSSSGGSGAQKHCMRAHAAAPNLPDRPAAEEAAAAAVQAGDRLALEGSA